MVESGGTKGFEIDSIANRGIGVRLQKRLRREPLRSRIALSRSVLGIILVHENKEVQE